jgi:hypothetical protein
MNFSEAYKDLPFTQKMQFHEAYVRGLFISIACDYERIMDDIIALCEMEKIFPSGFENLSDEDIIAQINEYKIQFITWKEMGKKLDKKCVPLLKLYNSEYFNKYEKCFDIVRDLVQDRNLMVHGYSDYNEQQNEKGISISFTNIVQNQKKKTLKKKIIVIQPYIKNLERYAIGIIELSELPLRMRKEVFGNRNIV